MLRLELNKQFLEVLAYAPYSDLIWCETATPNLEEAKKFADAIHEKFPGKAFSLQLFSFF